MEDYSDFTSDIIGDSFPGNTQIAKKVLSVLQWSDFIPSQELGGKLLEAVRASIGVMSFEEWLLEVFVTGSNDVKEKICLSCQADTDIGEEVIKSLFVSSDGNARLQTLLLATALVRFSRGLNFSHHVLSEMIGLVGKYEMDAQGCSKRLNTLVQRGLLLLKSRDL